MGIVRVQINGIDVVRERDHYLLRKDSMEMRCDMGELNEWSSALKLILTDDREMFEDYCNLLL